MNTAIKASGAEYIAILDSDDVLFEEALRKGIEFMDQHPDAGFCYGQVSTMDKSGHNLREKRFRGPKTTRVVNKEKELVELLSGESYIGHYIARRSCFEEIGLFKPELRMSEDWDMWIRLASRYNAGHIAEPTVKARFHVQGMTAKSKVETVKKYHVEVLEAFFQDPELGPRYRHLRKKAYFGLHCLLARVAALTGHKFLAIKHFIIAPGIYPAAIWDVKALLLLAGSYKVLLPQSLRNVIVNALIKMRLR
jgi:GT2 family glycosyltransferase